MKPEDLCVFVPFLLIIFIILISLPLALVWRYILCFSSLFFLHALSYIPVSRLKPILDDADRRSVRHSD